MNNIETVLKEALKKIDGAKDLRALEALKTEYLGKNGSVAVLLKSISQYPPEERKNIGFSANKAKIDIERALDDKRESLSKKVLDGKIKSERLDFSHSFAFPFPKGHFHPISQTIENISA
ncbi:MAG: phenylalanine--tRNA ligase subunit alpha, partial [Elusimicrobiota bacterium]|nr:phenylalanine--tRNA ligase subunit alpha [Elusimicrobiota bacterium]